MNTFGDRLKLLRGSLSQASLAELLKIKQTTLSNYERNRNEPNFETLGKICSHFGVSLEWLVWGVDPMLPGEELPISTPQPEQTQPSETASTTMCARCEKLEAKLERVEGQRDELADENRRLLKENGLLREENATLRERQRKEQASLFDERRHIPSSDDVLQNRPTICK